MHVAAHIAASMAILAYAARDKAGVEGFGLDCLEDLGRRVKNFRLIFGWYKL